MYECNYMFKYLLIYKAVTQVMRISPYYCVTFCIENKS